MHPPKGRHGQKLKDCVIVLTTVLTDMPMGLYTTGKELTPTLRATNEAVIHIRHGSRPIAARGGKLRVNDEVLLEGLGKFVRGLDDPFVGHRLLAYDRPWQALQAALDQRQ